MEAKKFRIGNLIEAEGKIIEIGMIKEKFISWNVAKHPENRVWNPFIPTNDKRLKGIRLNEEMLSIYGFKRSSEKLLYLPIPQIKSEIHFEKHAYGNVITLQSSVGMFIPNDIEYFHELQNLFFAITGTELELKTDV